MNNFYHNYFAEYKKLAFNDEVLLQLEQFKEIVSKVKSNNSKLIFAGNGASASIASHGAVDFTKQAKVRSITFNESNLITCYSNDYGYQNWVSEAIRSYSDLGDVVVLISVSGESPNIVKASETAKTLGLEVVTFSGRDSNNSLKLSGNLNFWLDGHYSGGITYMGKKNCPVEDELNAIEINLVNFNQITILIDDVRCFLPQNTRYPDYPSINYLIDWARRLNMSWRIENDIFIIKKN